MNECCFQIVIRQRACQNGVPVISERTYNNIPQNEPILLNHGYIMILSTYGSTNILVNITNNIFNISLDFSINSPGIGIFDLPIDGGTFRVSVASKVIPCNNDICCINQRRN